MMQGEAVLEKITWDSCFWLWLGTVAHSLPAEAPGTKWDNGLTKLRLLHPNISPCLNGKVYFNIEIGILSPGNHFDIPGLYSASKP